MLLAREFFMLKVRTDTNTWLGTQQLISCYRL